MKLVHTPKDKNKQIKAGVWKVLLLFSYKGESKVTNENILEVKKLNADIKL
jgi:hypothetical protein